MRWALTQTTMEGQDTEHLEQELYDLDDQTHQTAIRIVKQASKLDQQKHLIPEFSLLASKAV